MRVITSNTHRKSSTNARFKNDEKYLTYRCDLFHSTKNTYYLTCPELDVDRKKFDWSENKNSRTNYTFLYCSKNFNNYIV